MSDRATIRCWDPVQAHRAMTAQIWPLLKAHLMAGRRMVLTLAPETRSSEQNRLLHAALTDISQQVEWKGQKFTVEIWKRLCVAAWLREKKEQPMLIPALDGNGFDVIFERTSKLSNTQCSELLEWCFAFGADHEVKFRDRGLGDG
jgi:hypothetical protein